MDKIKEDIKEIGDIINRAEALGVPAKVCHDLRIWLDKEANEDPLAELVIRTSTSDNGDHLFQMGEMKIRSKTLRGCTLALGKHLGWGSTPESIRESLIVLPESNNKRLLVSILKG